MIDLAAALAVIAEPWWAPARVGRIQVRAGRDDLVDRVEDLVAELRVDRAELAFQLLERPRPDDRCSHRGMPDHERERKVDQADPRLLGELRELLDCVELLLVA